MTGTVDIAVETFAIAVLVAIAVIDVRRRVVPNRIVLPAAAIVLAARTAVHPSPAWIVAGLGAAALLLLGAVVRPGGMGMGDVKLALLLGVAVGRGVTVALFVALAAAALPSLVISTRRGWRGRTTAIPLAPFLALGGVVAFALGVAAA